MLNEQQHGKHEKLREDGRLSMAQQDMLMAWFTVLKWTLSIKITKNIMFGQQLDKQRDKIWILGAQREAPIILI